MYNRGNMVLSDFDLFGDFSKTSFQGKSDEPMDATGHVTFARNHAGSMFVGFAEPELVPNSVGYCMVRLTTVDFTTAFSYTKSSSQM